MPSALPDPLRAAWDEIDASERRIEAAMQAQDFAALAPLADARHERILQFFEQFPFDADSASLRLDLLRQLIARNSALLADSRARLGAAATASTQATHARRAMDAYRA